MGIFGFIKDVVLLPVDLTMDITGLSTIASDGNEPLRSGKRIESMGKNLDETLG